MFEILRSSMGSVDPWTTLLRYISERIAPSIGPFRPPDALAATG